MYFKYEPETALTKSLKPFQNYEIKFRNGAIFKKVPWALSLGTD